MSRRTPRVMLAGVVGLLGVAVVADRLGWLPGRGGPADADSAITSARERYLESLRALNQDRALLATRPAVDAALTAARGQWTAARQELVRGQTTELAEAAFRERILAAAADIGLSGVTASAVKLDAPDAARRDPALDALRPIALRVQLDTDDPARIYRLIDALENLPDARTAIDSVSIVGPGLPQLPAQATATIVVRAMALVGEGGA